MSLFGAMSTAVSGLASQSAAFGNISDAIANSQTTGYKRVDTAFSDFLTTSNATQNDSGSVVARPDYVNTKQGTITTSSNPLALAISGQGFFAVSNPTDVVSGQQQFDAQQYYTRAGDFQLDKNGYLVNSSGLYLNGWHVSSDGTVNSNALAPIQVTEATDQPQPTTTVSLSANLPPSGTTSTTPTSSTVSIYDAQGQGHQLTLNFTSTGTNAWTLAVTDDKGNTIGSAQLTFGADGTLSSVAQGNPSVTATSGEGVVTLSTLYPTVPTGNQTVSLDLGPIGAAGGLTQFAGNAYTLRSLTQNGVPPGDFSSLTATASGNIVANYDNGQSRVIAQVPVITFNASDALQRQDGSSFTATIDSGAPLAHAAGSSGAGKLVTSSIEQSNVDIGTEFTNLITAQQAYSANAKLITAAETMLQATINMKQ